MGDVVVGVIVGATEGAPVVGVAVGEEAAVTAEASDNRSSSKGVVENRTRRGLSARQWSQRACRFCTTAPGGCVQLGWLVG